MRKKVLIVVSSLNIGGITISLKSLLSVIDVQKYEVDVFSPHSGFYYNNLPNCKILPENIWLSYPLMYGSRYQRICQRLIYGLRYLCNIININLFPIIYKIGGKTIQSGEYDAVVCYSEGIAYKVSFFPSNNRIAWIHCDYKRHIKQNKKQWERIAYNRFHKIVCVSEFAKSSFCNIFPEYQSKTIAIYNIINVDYIRTMASRIEEDERFDTSCFVIISIGRLDPIKQFDLIPEIASNIKLMTSKLFKWYIIGDTSTGNQSSYQNRIIDAIALFNLTKEVILLGEKGNVYPYIKKSNVLVNLSKSEAFSLVNSEAKALKIPVITNCFCCAKETITEGKDGFIAPIENIPSKIVEMIEHPVEFKFSEIDNNQQLSCIYQLFE